MTKLYQEHYGVGQPLILLHGWGMHTAVWRDFAISLANYFHVVCIDLPAHGRSQALQECNLNSLSQAIAEVLPKELPCHIVGWSFGGSIAIRLATLYPQRCASLSMITANPCFVSKASWPGTSYELATSFSALLTQNVADTLKRFVALQCIGITDGKKLTRHIINQLKECPWPEAVALQHNLDVLIQSDLRDELQHIKCPVQCIFTDSDALIPIACGEAIWQLNSEIAVHVLPKSGHFPFVSNKYQIIDIIKRMI